jgi:hypothetical protein
MERSRKKNRLAPPVGWGENLLLAALFKSRQINTARARRVHCQVASRLGTGGLWPRSRWCLVTVSKIIVGWRSIVDPFPLFAATYSGEQRVRQN